MFGSFQVAGFLTAGTLKQPPLSQLSPGIKKPFVTPKQWVTTPTRTFNES
jgi:hypothetical protein